MTHNFFTRRKLSFAKKVQKGFSLLEALISIAVFTIIMVATAETFASMIQTKSEADRMRESHQKAQVAIESITKSIRSGVVIDPAPATPFTSDASTIRIYDYSQSLCIEYAFLGTALQKRTASIDRDECTAGVSLPDTQIMVRDTVKGNFDISWDDDNKYVTIRLLLISPNQQASTNQTRVQTTVAMRNLK